MINYVHHGICVVQRLIFVVEAAAIGTWIFFRFTLMTSRRLSQLTSKYIVIYTKLLEGLPTQQIAPHEDQDQFFANLFNLEVKNEYLRGELDRLTKESCLGRHKVRC